MQPRRHMIQNFLLIWVNENIDDRSTDYKNTFTQLRTVVQEIIVCTTPAQCIQVLNDFEDGKAFVISSETLVQHLVPKIHEMPCVDAIYIFCGNKARHEEWLKQWQKIRGVFTSIDSTCESLKHAVRVCDHNAVPISFMPLRITATRQDHQNTKQLPPGYMYTLLFKEIILEIDDDDEQKVVNDFIIYYREQKVPEDQLKRFQEEYRSKPPIYLYTSPMFLYSTLNRALWSLDTTAMLKMGFFIRKLHLQLTELYQEQKDRFQRSFNVYRGQSFTSEQFQQLQNAKGGLLSFNNFLSTSLKKEVAMLFAESTQVSIGNVAVVFIMEIDPTKVSASTTPFARLKEHSLFSDEEEILFSMDTVFNVGNINNSTSNARLWEVQLCITDENDPELVDLTRSMRNDCHGIGWFRMGELMYQLGNYSQAEELYKHLSEESAEYALQQNMPDMLETMSYSKQEHNKRFKSYDNSFPNERKTLLGDHSLLSLSYNRLGRVYKKIGDFSKALIYHAKSLQIKKTVLSLSHPDFATSYNDIGRVYQNMGDYAKALEYFEKSLLIQQKALPPNHPDVASSYNNIGEVYHLMDDYSKALEYYEKAHRIYEKAFPPNHPHFAASYNVIGLVYNGMGDYLKALEYLEKSLLIRQKALPSNHPSLAASYNNIASVYHAMCDYKAALRAITTAHTIKEKALPEGSPNFAYLYRWFGGIYQGMKDYPQALEYFDKCLTLRQKTLPDNHPLLTITHSYLGNVHRLMGDHEKALKYHKKALNIQENVKCSPLQVATTYANLGEAYCEMKQYEKAIEYYEKARQIREEKSPRNHPSTAALYHSVAKLFLSTGKYPMALKHAQQAVEMAQERLPSTHPHLVEYRETLEKARKKN